MIKKPLPRLDVSSPLRDKLLSYSRFNSVKKWTDGTHTIICDDIQTTNLEEYENTATLAIHDPPYNLVAFDIKNTNDFIEWCSVWLRKTDKILKEHASLYVWLGADIKNNFSPFPEFILNMKNFENFKSKNFITLRNQRGYGTLKNWMAIRQELLFYVKNNPTFNVLAEYTEIPKVLKGFYKEINGEIKENIERSKSDTIRAGNVWMDIQQVFFMMEENINGCYAQKPLKSIERIIEASSNENDLVVDFFAHSGTTLLAAEKLKRKCVTVEIDPLFSEITLRRLERFRKYNKLGWQNSNPFEEELQTDKELQTLYEEYLNTR